MGKNLYDYLSDIYMHKAMQSRAFQESQKYILPARFDDAHIPGVLPTTGYISLTERSPEKFVEVIHKKLINNGRTVPSESIRKALFSTTTVPRFEPQTPSVTVISSMGVAVVSAAVVAIADNGTTKSGQTDAHGKVTLTIPTRRHYQLLVAHADYPAALIPSWDPADGIQVTLVDTENTGSLVCHSTGYIPGLEGRLNPIFEAEQSAYLYADNIAINGGKKQPVHLKANEAFELEDSNGVIMEVRLIYIQGRTSLLQFIRPRYDS